jgi:predicted dehydrogenase
LVALLGVAYQTLGAAEAAAQEQAPVRIAVARLTHGHVWRVWNVHDPNVEVVGIYEPNVELAELRSDQWGFDRALIYTDLGRMMDDVRPDAVLAMGSTFEHLAVVEAAAPRGIHVMVEKPLAVSLDHALRIDSLATRHRIHVVTNYETTWYPSMDAVHDLVQDDSAIGLLRKIVAHDANRGPLEGELPRAPEYRRPEFMEWLTDPEKGGGALVDFGCYGINLATWLMGGAAPISVTAVTQQIKPEVYPRVDDEATIILTYPHAQAIIQASWNWPVPRKDLEVYGTDGYVIAPDAWSMRVGRPGMAEETVTFSASQPPWQNEFQYIAAVVRGTVQVSETDLASLNNNVTVVRILDAARQSAVSGTTIHLETP